MGEWRSGGVEEWGSGGQGIMTVDFLTLNSRLQTPDSRLQTPESQLLAPNSNYRMVTNSSADEGWIPTVASKSFLVAPILTAIATP